MESYISEGSKLPLPILPDMMPIIEIENLSKKYRLGSLHQPYLTLRENLRSVFTSFKQKKADDLLAINNISFNVLSGESLGIIGKNGAGKSTLLKILSRITPPTSGRIILRGRVASLLEVGTGFHGELSGRENIYFNGSLLGMKKKEVDKKLDEIIDFAGIERFINTPLKHYSSGMQVRLAFSVAAHLEAEILLFDEVLAVGDVEFQKKSLGKMNEVARSGRTVFLVSHNMGAIDTLCSRAILLHEGKVIEDAKPQAAINKYFAISDTKSSLFTNPDASKISCFTSARLTDENKNEKYEFFFNESIIVELDVRINESIKDHILAVVLANNYNSRICVVFKDISSLPEGDHKVILHLPSSIISPGFFHFNLFLYRPNDKLFDKIENACSFQILDNGLEDSQYFNGEYGVFIGKAYWKIQ